MNHISTDGIVRIPILRGVCKKCEDSPTHSIKPCFLPGKHQYNLHCREKAVVEYESGTCGLHKALKAAFPGMNVSIMNLKYWIYTSRKKAEKLTERVLASLQQAEHNIDMVSKYISCIKSGNILKNLVTLCMMYVNKFGFKTTDNTGIFLLINTVSNEECTGYYI